MWGLLIATASADPVAAPAAAAPAAAVIRFERGFLGPFALHPDKGRVAVVNESDGGKCYPADGGPRFSTLYVYDVGDVANPRAQIDLGGGCTDEVLWSGPTDQVIVRTRQGRTTASLRVYDASTARLVKDLGTRDWGSLHLSRDGHYLASVHEESAGEGKWTYRTALYRVDDWRKEAETTISVENAVRRPVFIQHGFGVLHLEAGRLWQYDLAQGRLIVSREADAASAEVMQLIESASPGGEAMVYIANDFQSGFDKPLPKLYGASLPKHVFAVPTLKPVCGVTGEGFDALRDFQKAWLGTRSVARPGDAPPQLYQRAVGEDSVVAFLMPPEDPFTNPFGSGQTAWVIRRTGEGTCAATAVAPLGRDPFYFDANEHHLALSSSKHASANAYRGLSLYVLP